MKERHERANRLTIRRIMAAYTNASPVVHSLSRSPYSSLGCEVDRPPHQPFISQLQPFPASSGSDRPMCRPLARGPRGQMRPLGSSAARVRLRRTGGIGVALELHVAGVHMRRQRVAVEQRVVRGVPCVRAALVVAYGEVVAEAPVAAVMGAGRCGLEGREEEPRAAAI